MDTSQRGMGLDWANARELIRRSLAEARTVPGADLACGVGTDQLDAGRAPRSTMSSRAYEEQLGHVESAWRPRHPDGEPRAVRASRRRRRLSRRLWPADPPGAAARSSCTGSARCSIPQLAGYWGSRDFEPAMETVLTLIREHAGKDRRHQDLAARARKEVELRRAPARRRHDVYRRRFQLCRADRGRRQGISHGLLGIFDPIAPAAAAALGRARPRATVRATTPSSTRRSPLSRKIFEAPTQYYKAGVVFLAWLNGFQQHFRMVGGANRRAASCTMPISSASPTRPGCSRDPGARGAPHGASSAASTASPEEETSHARCPLLDIDIYDQIRETARRFAEDVVRPRAAELDESEAFPAEIYARDGGARPVRHHRAGRAWRRRARRARLCAGDGGAVARLCLGRRPMRPRRADRHAAVRHGTHEQRERYLADVLGAREARRLLHHRGRGRHRRLRHQDHRDARRRTAGGSTAPSSGSTTRRSPISASCWRAPTRPPAIAA